MFAIVSPRTLLLQLRAPCAFQFKPGNRTALKKIIDALPGAVSSPLAGPLAAWMPPSSLQGRTCGVSRKRRWHRALD
ncbi:TPA: hypothetical protein HH295_06125 [Xanthomonas vasicola pv. zeae]|uniref:Uncharacterized protein n=1 Tax=Xanthomonas vasicola pv. vasculorum TaxID=325776 RepID=A0AAE8JZ28_XANVA|nr:hypothetical protein C7V42_20435 [Xanthomonas vasicola pv. vasculorum]AZR28508.1 hypothetical protein NX80_020925 [Xanthomonas vasicola pv. arecae]AZR36496.1 hypothetical protein NX08_020780 [Xanthomonas vasicola]HHZ22363.1 hypothetical protein [Xanthomonas vasicola pv. zeae]AZM72809.1 hypothetical protein CXP37_20450 [Xanthomonas vasicola pv. vasculorum]